MHPYSFVKTHYTWEDFLGMILGVVIVASPLLAGQMASTMVSLNAALVGTLVFALAALSFVGLQRWEEVVELLCGVWLIAAPFAFGYVNGGQLRYWHFALGCVVALLAALELWQDWRLSAKELERHAN
jgi:SPW repeat